MNDNLEAVYEPDSIEKHADKLWTSGNHFHADPDAPGKSYTIVIPPPNVTAALHLGHALNNTLQDILIRFKRMQQFNTLWMPGTDHAGIATQTVVEKRLLKEKNKRRTDFKRDQFVQHVQAWKDEYEQRIINQLKKMGCSCDWQRTRFTMDQTCAQAVRTNFFKLFKDKLIYRGKRLVNWDPATQTVLADDEVEHETVKGHFWYLKYPLTEPVTFQNEKITHITVATTRPETMLGDTAIAMNPNDPRAKLLQNKTVKLPIAEREIPIITDEHVVLPDSKSQDEKAKFSTGFLKVTPAHDPNDWEIGQRNELEIINIMAPDGSISDKHGWHDCSENAQFLLGMDRFEAREAIVEWFRKEKLLEDVREHAHEVGHSYRSHVPIEPYLSDQWYIAVKKPIPHLAQKFGQDIIPETDIPQNSLAGLALKPLLDKKLKFIPSRYAGTYKNWLQNLRDWPISRQLWWGHQIPIWSADYPPKKLSDDDIQTLKILAENPEVLCRASINTEDSSTEIPLEKLTKDCQTDQTIYICLIDDNKKLIKQIESMGFKRDQDVLDTWFSSALWPFSTMGWPNDTPEMKKYYPGSVLCTAREIITLWVSRMVMMGQYCVNDIPFKDVYIHAMIQDGQGRKMSKSLGNGIDPLIAIDSHGADAMRFTLANMTTDTQDVRMPVEPITLPDGRKVNTSPKFDIGRSFCNKLWNASRFAMMNLESTDPEKFDPAKMDLTDMWILSRLAQTIDNVTKSLESYKFMEPLNELYRFFWNDFCDWYLEWTKPRINDPDQKQIAQNVLALTLDQILRLLHPFIPFITEGIFSRLNKIAPKRGLKNLVSCTASDVLVKAQWPEKLDNLIDEAVQYQIQIIQTVIGSIREMRSEHNVSPGQNVSVSVKTEKAIADILNENKNLIQSLANTEQFIASPNEMKTKNAASSVAEEMEIFVHDVIDPQAEKARLLKQKQQIEKGLNAANAKLSNENFVNKAKPQVVQQTRDKQQELTDQLETINKHLKELEK